MEQNHKVGQQRWKPSSPIPAPSEVNLESQSGLGWRFCSSKPPCHGHLPQDQADQSQVKLLRAFYSQVLDTSKNRGLNLSGKLVSIFKPLSAYFHPSSWNFPCCHLYFLVCIISLCTSEYADSLQPPSWQMKWAIKPLLFFRLNISISLFSFVIY